RRNMPDRKDGTRWEAVPLEGELTAGQLETLHEVTATAFENYLMKGEAPSKKLEGVFSKLKEWLKKLYNGALAAGIEPSQDVRLVFDRMLATDRAMQDKGLKASFGQEKPFLDTLEGLDPKTSAVLEKLRNRAEAQTAAKLDAKTLKDRKARYNAYVKEGEEARITVLLYCLRDFSMRAQDLPRVYLPRLTPAADIVVKCFLHGSVTFKKSIIQCSGRAKIQLGLIKVPLMLNAAFVN
ncbi:MAG: hypothetical protein FWH34_05580, partial [Desulfovibrionaceae bacterium]|nr:hypothetical protein [Desulfovibrionaceae bacterium]